MNRLLFSLLGTAALAAPLAAVAQTEVTEDQTTTQRTSDTGDLTVASGVTITPANGSAVVVDSSDDATIEGNLNIEDRDDATALDIQTGNSGNVVVNGSISVTEDFNPEDTDDDRIVDGRFAQGSGRTGILISGASTFTGNVTTGATSRINVEGNDSSGIRLASGATLAGNLSTAGAIAVRGDNSAGLAVDGTVTGDVTNRANITTLGEGASAIRVAGNVSGGFDNAGSISNTGYRFATRPQSRVRELLDDEDFLQAASAVQISGSVSGGLFFREVVETVTAEDGTTSQNVVARSSVSQAGGAPAILIDGDGTPLAFGIVAEITDVNDPGFNADLQYAFVNQGDFVASGIYDDVNATVFEARGATFAGGISNSGSMQASTFRSGDDGTADTPGQTGLARVIVLGDASVAEAINNSGAIIASVNEAVDTIFADRDNILAPRQVQAIAIDIAETAETSTLTNSGTISALVTGRNGVGIAVRDASGTLSVIENTGGLGAIGINSDTVNLESADFNLIALDLRNNTVGVTLNQFDNDTGTPNIAGDILLGSGGDVITSTAGSIVGAIDFGDGANSLSLADTAYDGRIDNSGSLALAVTGGGLTLRGSAPLDITDGSLSGGTTFRPTIDGQAGTASTLVASGDLTIGSDVGISPILESIVGGNAPTRFALAQAGNLDFQGDLSALGEGFSPFLYDTVYTLDAASNTLFVDFRLRSTDELGLDTVQSSAFAATFDALANNPELASAVLNITNGEVFNAAYNQLLPEFAAAARQFVLANTDGAVGAVGSHLDAARRGQARPGGLWFEEFFYYADRERAELSEQYRGQGFGFTGGFDTAMGPFHTVGINLGFSSTEVEDTVGVDEPLDVLTAQAGLYAGFSSGNLGISAYAGGGYNSFDSNRVVNIGSYAAEASGDWDGYHYNASLRAGYDMAFGKRFWARPVVSLDYLNLTENAYTEDGPLGIAFDIDKRQVDVGAVTALLNLGMEFEGRRTWLRPALRVGYRNEFTGDVLTSGTFAGLDTPFALQAADFPSSGLLLGLSVLAGSDYSSFGFDVDTDIRDGFIRTTGRVVVRILF